MRSWLAIYLGLAATVAGADDSLIGVWSYERSYGNALEGTLTVNRDGERWSATIGGQTTKPKTTWQDIRFEFRGGRYRGSLDDDVIRGFWIRPGVTEDPRYPGGSSQPFATPLDLKPTREDSWEGTVKSLPDPFTLYLRTYADEGGALMAAFRNPEQNSHGPASVYRVTRDGATVKFEPVTDPPSQQGTIEAKLLAQPDRLALHWDDVAADIELARRTDDEARNFFPRPLNAAPYVYERPPDKGDGWETARAGEVGIDEAVVTEMIRGIAAMDPARRRASLIHSLLIARQGKLVVEEYFFGSDRDRVHDLRSAGKTFASVLLGSLRMDWWGTTPVMQVIGGGAPQTTEKSIPLGPDTRIYEVMSSRGPFANPDPRKAQITLAHLLTHSAGLACDDNDDKSPGNENTMQTQRQQPDWWKYTLDLPMAHDPGTRYAYCSANINLVGGVLTTLTDTWLPELFRKAIAEPLQFGEWHWNLQPTDEGYLGGGAYLRPRDLLKIGQVYLDDGRWKGRYVVAPAWVRQSTSPRIKVTPETTGLTPEVFGDYYFEGADALAWHMNSIHAGERTYNAYAATGNGGQLLIVMPELEMTAVFTGGNYLQGGIWNRWADHYIGGQIIPAIHKGEEK